MPSKCINYIFSHKKVLNIKIAIQGVLVFVKHNSGVFRLIVTQIIHLISILVDIYTRHKYYLNYSVVRL